MALDLLALIYTWWYPSPCLVHLPPRNIKKASRRWQHTPSPLDKSFHLFTYNFSQASEQTPPPFSLPNPLSCLSALFINSNFIVLVVGGLQYTIFGCLAASLSTQIIHLYSLNYLTAGLLYLPSGIGGMVAAYLNGRLFNYHYRVTARKYGLPVSKTSDNLARFPIERARLRSVSLFLILSAIATAGYGWTLQAKTSIAAPLVM